MATLSWGNQNKPAPSSTLTWGTNLLNNASGALSPVGLIDRNTKGLTRDDIAKYTVDDIAKLFPNVLPYNDNSLNKNTLRMNTTVTYKGKEYPVYKLGDFYYLSDGSNLGLIGDNIADIKKNNAANVKINNVDFVTKNPLSKGFTTKEETKKETKKVTPTKTGSGSGGGGSASPTSGNTAFTSYVLKELEKRDKEIAELQEQLKPRSADELAKIHGIDYNLEHILNDYNQRTNNYYDNALLEHEKLRTDTARNNAQYINSLLDEYNNSYQNVAPTPGQRIGIGASALQAQHQANDNLSASDYEALQGENYLEEARKAELENNPYAAEQYYNSIGNYLSTLSANLNSSDVRRYVAALDNYANLYGATRTSAIGSAKASAQKYSGLANAAGTRAGSALSNYQSALNNATNQSNWDKYYQFYLATNPKAGAQGAASTIRQNTLGSGAYYTS